MEDGPIVTDVSPVPSAPHPSVPASSEGAAAVSHAAIPLPAGPPPKRRIHLLAALLASLLAGAILASVLFYCDDLESRYVHALAPEFTSVKLQGIALQKEAYAQKDLLVLYGSSELVKDIPNNATEFFEDYPTGFGIFPVGKPGSASLSAALRLAAVGRSAHGKKAVYSISPGWFFSTEVDPKYYIGNFSGLQASELAFSTVLSWGLKRDLARRMIDYPKTLENLPILEFALDRLAGSTFLDRCGYAAVWPLGVLNNMIGRGQDHVEVALHIIDEDKHLDEEPERSGRGVKWSTVLKRAARIANSVAVQAKRSEVRRNAKAKKRSEKEFVETLAKAREWEDMELLMRVFKEIGAEPLFLSMPIEDIRLEVYGVSTEARADYTDRLNDLAKKYRIPLLDFHEYEKDPAFLYDFLDHLSGKGWLYYNKALDDFFHSRKQSEPFL